MHYLHMWRRCVELSSDESSVDCVFFFRSAYLCNRAEVDVAPPASISNQPGFPTSTDAICTNQARQCKCQIPRWEAQHPRNTWNGPANDLLANDRRRRFVVLVLGFSWTAHVVH
jgi:hypothetical protein